MTTFDRVKEIIAEHLGCDESKITMNAMLVEDLGADSLDSVELVMAFEENFCVEFDDDDAEKCKTVMDIVDAINKRLMKTLNGQIDISTMRAGISAATAICHNASASAGWWTDIHTGEDLRGKRNKGELLCLVHSEISEAMEGERKNLMDDKLPHRRMAEVELADACIRIFDYAGAHGYDLAGAMVEKMAYNAQRADHKPENRRQEGGKAF